MFSVDEQISIISKGAEDIIEIAELEEKVDPWDLKMKLAFETMQLYHGSEAALLLKQEQGKKADITGRCEDKRKKAH